MRRGVAGAGVWGIVRQSSARTVLAGWLVAGVALGGCSVLPQHGVVARPLGTLPVPAQQQITTVAVQRGNVVNSAQLAGQLQPRQTALLYFRVNGQVKTLNMSNNKMVHAGDVLATLDTGNLAFQINQAQLTIERDQLHIDDVANSVNTSPPVSQADAEKRTVQLQQAQIQLQQDDEALQKLQLQLAQYQIVAPFDGRIMNVSKHLGDGVGQFEVIAQLQDTSGVRFVAKLTAAQAQIISPGQAVKLTLSSDPQNAYTTTVNSVQIPSDNAVAIAKQNNGLGGLTDPQVTLNPPKGFTSTPDDVGTAFTAIVTVAEADSVLYLPKNVVFALNGLDYVNLYENGHVLQRPVTVGLGGDQDTVISSGLNEGDTVVQQ